MTGPENTPKIGETWVLTLDTNPWEEAFLVRIVDLRDGWVRYRFVMDSESDTLADGYRTTRVHTFTDVYSREV